MANDDEEVKGNYNKNRGALWVKTKNIEKHK